MTQQRILIIDDDPDIVTTVKANLELDGFAVLSAAGGAPGLAAARTEAPDLVLLDLGLPDIDGIKVCQTLRRESEVPVIMLSARIRTVLRRVRRSETTATHRNGNIVLDFRTLQATLQGRHSNLTRTEFALLELFIAHPGETLSRDFIQSQNWGDSKLYSHSRAVDVHVQRLRKKIEENPQVPRFIVTVAGVGYKFEPNP